MVFKISFDVLSKFAKHIIKLKNICIFMRSASLLKVPKGVLNANFEKK